jgi:peptidyl-prolyl cis-trans isomerase C
MPPAPALPKFKGAAIAKKGRLGDCPPPCGRGCRNHHSEDHMTALLTRSALFAAVIAIAAPAMAQDNPVIAKVDGTEIRQSDLIAAEEEIGQNVPPMPPEAKREYLLTYLTDMLIVAKAAEARKLGDTPEFKRKMEIARTKLLMDAILTAEAKAAVTDEAMKKVYAEATKQMGEEQEVRARHILVETEDQAKAILADLNKGGDFAKIAKEKSKDPGAAAQGGDLGYFSKEQMVPEFAEVAFKLDKGKLSDPVKSQFGWHIILVEDKRTKPVPEFDKVKDQIETYVQRKAQSDLVTKLRTEAKVEKMDAPKPAEAAKPADPSKK